VIHPALRLTINKPRISRTIPIALPIPTNNNNPVSPFDLAVFVGTPKFVDVDAAVIKQDFACRIKIFCFFGQHESKRFLENYLDQSIGFHKFRKNPSMLKSLADL
jgi:hypothetical protein